MVCFFGKRTAFLPSPMVARNAWGSNARPFLEKRFEGAEFRVLWNIRLIGVWRAIFVEPSDSRGEDISASSNPVQIHGTAPLTGCESFLLRVGLADVTAVTGVQLQGMRTCITRSEPNQAIRTSPKLPALLAKHRDYTGAADKAVNLVGCKSPHHQLPGQVVSIRACTMRCRCHSSCRRSRFSQLATQIWGRRSSSINRRIIFIHTQ